MHAGIRPSAASGNTLNDASTAMHQILQRIRNEESYCLNTKWVTIHGFRTAMTQEQVLHAANMLLGDMQLQMINSDILEAMEKGAPW